MDSDLAWVNGKSGRQSWRYHADAFQHSIISEAIYHFTILVISQIYTVTCMITFYPSTMNKHSNHHHVTGIIMSLLYAVICRLPISSLSSLSLQTSLSSVAFCTHQVIQQLVRHPGSVRPDEQNSLAEFIIHFNSKSNKVSKLCHLISNCVYWPTLCYTCKWWHAL